MGIVFTRPNTKKPAAIMNRYRSARGPLATYLTWLQAGRPNHHRRNFINLLFPLVNGQALRGLAAAL
ncbi:hypothetical protein FHT28_002655 [Rhizobium sp. SG570]|nr:hypothetical protein [Rhizobium sp. SG570]